jgi:uncharacterized protein YciI
VSPRFAYFYLMKDDPDRVRAVVPRHVAHWQSLGLTGYLGGPFADRTGGLITFETHDSSRASDAVDTDPFIQQGLLDACWLKEWVPE